MLSIPFLAGLAMLFGAFLSSSAGWAIGGLTVILLGLLGLAIYRVIRPPDWL